MRCHPDFCPRAKGYYDRELPALMDISREKRWDPARIDALCEQYCLCPFEFSLLLCETADVVVCDYNLTRWYRCGASSRLDARPRC